MHRFHFGAVIRRLRLQQGLTQEKLAVSANLERTFISMLERGIKQPSLNTISNLATAFGVKNYQLLQLVEQEIHRDTLAACDIESEHELRQLAALEAEQEQSRINDIANAIPVVLFSRTPMPEYATTFISKNVEILLGFARESFLGPSSFWLEHVHPEDRSAVLARLRNLKTNMFLNQQYRILDANGNWRHVHEELKLVADKSGTGAEILGFMTE